MAEPHNETPGDPPLNERLLDLFVYVPAGIAVAVVEEIPRLAERGRERLGVRVSSARALGHFAVRAGQQEFRRRSGSLLHRGASTPPLARTAPASHAPTTAQTRSGPRAAAHPGATRDDRVVRAVPPPANGHVPAVSTLSIPGFDTLSASQVVQRLDGLNRAELVSVRAYEASTRGRRTILSRVDQLLDERS
jgi:hypothetical protein